MLDSLPIGRYSSSMDTKQLLIEHASELVRTRGYAAFSYADLAERVGIRKASVHHHFAGKEDLGLALVAQYTTNFSVLLESISKQGLTAPLQLRGYADLYKDSFNRGWGCLCGMLAFQADALPISIVESVRAFMRMNISWIVTVVELGKAKEQIASRKEAHELAQFLLSSCQGALLIARVTRSSDSFDQALRPVFEAFEVTA
jgi:TetR/AcrR family transcriptional regulator, transcriptional repressor for nem operon